MSQKINKNKKKQKLTFNDFIKKSINSVVLVTFVFSLGLPVALKAKHGPTEIVSAYASKKTKKPIIQKQLVLRSARDVTAKEVQRVENKPDMVIRATVTAYTSTPDQTDDSPFIAATGKRVYDGMIAANNLPFGTKIKIPDLFGEKVFTVDDRMNSRYGLGKLDVWMDTSRHEALKFGVKYVEAEIYYPKYTLVRK